VEIMKNKGFFDIDIPKFFQKKSRELQIKLDRLERDALKILKQKKLSVKINGKNTTLDSLFLMFEKDLKKMADKVLKDEIVTKFKDGRVELEKFIENKVSRLMKDTIQPKLKTLDEVKKTIDSLTREFIKISSSFKGFKTSIKIVPGTKKAKNTVSEKIRSTKTVSPKASPVKKTKKISVDKTSKNKTATKTVKKSPANAAKKSPTKAAKKSPTKATKKSLTKATKKSPTKATKKSSAKAVKKSSTPPSSTTTVDK